MVRVVIRRPLTAEARVRARIIPCRICGGQSGSVSRFSSSSSPVDIIPPVSIFIYDVGDEQ
jgi:hypothetical protein